MKLLLFKTALIATICYVSAGKTQRLIAAMNAGLIPGLNGGMMGRFNPAMMAGGLNPAMVAAGGLTPAMAAAGGLTPAMAAAGGLNPAMVAGGGAGFIGQPQFAQFVPRVPAFALPAPVPNIYPVPAVNAFPYMGVPQVAPMNPAQQPLMGNNGGAAPQQLPLQPDPLRRFRRQIMKQDDTMKTTIDTQIPPPTEKVTAAPCDDHDQHQDV